MAKTTTIERSWKDVCTLGRRSSSRSVTLEPTQATHVGGGAVRLACGFLCIGRPSVQFDGRPSALYGFGPGARSIRPAR